MRLSAVLLSTLATLACGPESSPPPQSPPPGAPPPGYVDPNYAQAQAQAQAISKAAMDEQARQNQAAFAQQAQADKTLSDVQAQAVAQEEAQKNALREACEKTRAQRVADVQRYAAAEVGFAKRVVPRFSEIKSKCSQAGHREVTVRSGKLDSHIQMEKPTCKGGIPSGLTEQEVVVALYRMQPGAPDDSGISVASESEYAEANRKCRSGDQAAGFDSEVKKGDAAGLAKVLEWKAK